MATYFVASGGSNTSPYDTWAKAATSLATALAAATSNGDVVVIQYNAVPSGDKEVSSDTTYTAAANVSIVSASNDGGSSYTLTVMGTSNWIGNSTTNRSITFAGDDKTVYLYGLTVRVSGSTVDHITLANSLGQVVTADTCYLWLENTSSTAAIRLSTLVGAVASAINCVFRFGASGHSLRGVGYVEVIGGSVSSDGTIPTAMLTSGSADNMVLTGVDLSAITGTLCGDSQAYARYVIERCKLGAGVEILAAQTSNPTAATPYVVVSDCSSGDTHTFFGAYNGVGRAVCSTACYVTAGAAAQSWEIITSANCSPSNPFITPWIDMYNSGTSEITPYIECLRNNGTATKYTDNQVWAEFSYKDTSGSTIASGNRTDRQARADILAGTSATVQADGVGTGSWTIGSSNSPASFKCDSGTSMTPDEVGYIRCRIGIGIASVANLFIDPQIRT
jgi:hypothetical protein